MTEVGVGGDDDPIVPAGGVKGELIGRPIETEVADVIGVMTRFGEQW